MIMKGVLTYLIQFITDEQVNNILNIPLLIITLVALLIALWICIVISKKNKLYIRNKEDKKDNAYT